MKQNYSNHARYYAPHHFILLPLLLVLMITGIVQAFKGGTHQLEWILFSILVFCILFLAVMLRQHYALGNQNRIVRLEFRLRYFELYGKTSAGVEKDLSFAQIAALRFAADDEFGSLLEKAVKENMPAKDIKQSIRHWQGDHMRL